MRYSYKSTIKTYDRLGKKFLKIAASTAPQERGRFAKLIPRKGRVLDVGCAGGRDADFFFRKGFEAVGIDASGVFIAEAKKLNPKIEFKVMDVRDIKFPSSSFDAIWAHAILLHVQRKDVPGVLRKFRRILKPDGILHVRVKHGRGEGSVKEALLDGAERSFTYFGKGELERLMKAAGFRIIYSAFLPDELKRKDVKWITTWGRRV